MSHAIIMGARFSDACKQGITGHVHSAFDSAVNIEISRSGDLINILTLLCAGSDVMPAALVTSMKSGGWRMAGVQIGKGITINENGIYLDTKLLVTGVGEADIWQPLTKGDAETLPRLTHLDIAARCDYVQKYVMSLGWNEPSLPKMTLSDFDPTKLLGLGCGLTPSGDDFLCGVLFSLRFCEMVYRRADRYLPTISRSVRQNMARMTNEISRHFLGYALEGLWGNATEQFLVALFQGDFIKLRHTIDHKLSYGATSGADEIFGIMFGFREMAALFADYCGNKKSK